jgi:hypothetical protein
MRLRTWLSASAALALVALILGGPLLTAQAPKSAPPTRDGFAGRFILVETKAGDFLLLERPEVRTLAGNAYLVGRTISVPLVTHDKWFEDTTQWVALTDIRRMGDTDSDSIVTKLSNIAVEQQIREKEKKQLSAAK